MTSTASHMVPNVANTRSQESGSSGTQQPTRALQPNTRPATTLIVNAQRGFAQSQSKAAAPKIATAVVITVTRTSPSASASQGPVPGISLAGTRKGGHVRNHVATP